MVGEDGEIHSIYRRVSINWFYPSQQLGMHTHASKWFDDKTKKYYYHFLTSKILAHPLRICNIRAFKFGPMLCAKKWAATGALAVAAWFDLQPAAQLMKFPICFSFYLFLSHACLQFKFLWTRGSWFQHPSKSNRRTANIYGTKLVHIHVKSLYC